MTLVHEAQALGRRGFRVHPLKSKSQPYTKYSETATSDPAAIAVLWQYFPGALIGICTGQGLVVIDDDRRAGLDDSLPMTLIATTPKGGYHHYYRCSTPVRNSAGKVAEGVDVRGEGGYVVAPPSEGRTWFDPLIQDEPHNVPPVDELPTMPGVLLAACLKQEASASSFEPREHVPAGERHDYLVRFAGWALANELAADSDDLYDIVVDHAVAVCDPWPSREMSGVLRHIAGICRWVIDRETQRG